MRFAYSQIRPNSDVPIATLVVGVKRSEDARWRGVPMPKKGELQVLRMVDVADMQRKVRDSALGR